MDKYNFYNRFQGKGIEIPMLQRDYVQGLDSGLINGFLDALLSATREKPLFLNYIYGKCSDIYFIPIDGQQRLTTLWVYHLYMFSRLGEPFNVQFRYKSREYADVFCRNLLFSMPKIDYQKEGQLKDTIMEEPWFMEDWKSDLSVMSMIYTLNFLHEKVKDWGTEKLREYVKTLMSDDAPIRFSFLDMTEKNLDEDIYLKMNGRGRKLSDFETLKSWIDGKLEKMDDKDFVQNWKKKIDNEWTDFFWRYKKDAEEIDKIQYTLIYRLLLIYWIIKGYSASIIEDKDIRTISQILELPDTEDLNEAKQNIFNNLISLIKEGDYQQSKYIFDYVNLFDFDCLSWIDSCMDKLIGGLSKKLDDFGVNRFFQPTTDSSCSATYQFFLKDNKNEINQTLSYCCAALYSSFQEQSMFNTSMRIWRNLIHNSASESQSNILKTIANAGNEYVVNLLTRESSVLDSSNSGLNRAQLKEEKMKQLPVNQNNQEIIKAEEFSFFKGSVRFLFTNDKFDDLKWQHAQERFKVNNDDIAVLNLKNLISKMSSLDSITGYNKICLDSKSPSWRNILLRENLKEQVSIFLSDNLISDQGLQNYTSNCCSIEKMVQEELVKTRILNATTWDAFQLNYSYSHYVLFPYNSKAGWKKYVIGTTRNSILNRLLKENIVEFDNDYRLENTGFFWGYDIWFKYKNGRFLWTVQWNNEEYPECIKYDNQQQNKSQPVKREIKYEEVISILDSMLA